MNGPFVGYGDRYRLRGVGLRVDAKVLLERRDQRRHELHRDHDLGANRRLDDVIRFGPRGSPSR